MIQLIITPIRTQRDNIAIVTRQYYFIFLYFRESFAASVPEIKNDLCLKLKLFQSAKVWDKKNSFHFDPLFCILVLCVQKGMVFVQSSSVSSYWRIPGKLKPVFPGVFQYQSRFRRFAQPYGWSKKTISQSAAGWAMQKAAESSLFILVSTEWR